MSCEMGEPSCKNYQKQPCGFDLDHCTVDCRGYLESGMVQARTERSPDSEPIDWHTRVPLRNRKQRRRRS